MSTVNGELNVAIRDYLLEHLVLEINPRSTDPEDNAVRLSLLVDGVEAAAVEWSA